MFDKFKKWWNKDQDRLTELERAVRELAEAKMEAEAKAAEHRAEVIRLQDEKDEQERRKNGKDPYVEIKSADFNADRGIQIELDWNDSFISLLRENGIKGKTDEVVVQKWLAFLYDDLIQRIDESSIEEITTENKPNEFE